jgi:outer membrane protein assembly factor BamE (lipoprotein component of BamABCDE complex)
MRLRRTGAVICLVLFTAALIAGCGSTEANFDKVQVGMTTEQVKGIMGEPQSQAGVMGAGQWVYNDKYVIQFLGGKVVSKVKQ